MNIEEIKELAQLLKQNDLSALEVNQGDSHIRMERTVTAAAPAVTETAAAAPIPAAASAPAQDAPGAGVDFNNAVEVKSPMVGVFYAAPSPEAEPYVRVGKRVKKGDVLCIIEAMKLMNEIVAEQDGEILDVCARNGDVVEFGQKLFMLL